MNHINCIITTKMIDCIQVRCFKENKHLFRLSMAAPICVFVVCKYFEQLNLNVNGTRYEIIWVYVIYISA